MLFRSGIREELALLRESIEEGTRQQRRDSMMMREDFARNRELNRQILVEVVQTRERAQQQHELQIDVLATLAAEIRGWRQEGPGGAPA